MKKAWIPMVALLAATPASAQTGQDAASLAGVRSLYESVRGYITASAEQMPEDKYSFRPTPEVRTFGEIIGHVADSQYGFCAPVRGEKAPTMPSAEKLTSKAELVKAVKDAFAYCDAAYGIPASKLNDALTFFGQPHTKLSVLAFNMAHDFEHYGNLVTYMRINGMVPPSSQGGM
ncbi:MAG: DinB family protein [Gemmatimonadetes bacterium]|nr:DinB family protein [Gemmatimonadota bacterium]